MKPMMKPTKKRLKFKEGDAVPGFDSPERKALLERAMRFAAAREEGKDLSAAQEKMLREQEGEGRKYGLRGEEPPRAAARPAPRPAPAAARPAQAAARPAGDAETIDASSGRGMRRTAMEQAQEQEGADMGRAMEMLAARENARAAIESANNAPRARNVRSEPEIVRPADYERRIRAQALEPSYPLESMIGGGGALRGAAEGVRALARRGANAAEQAAAKVFSRPQAREVRVSEEIKQTAAKRLEERRQAARDRLQAAREARRNRETNRMEGESTGTVKPRTNPKRETPPPRDLDEMRMSGEGMGFKRGGKAKFAKGGAVSARADGIAKRGRTNCKIY